MHCRHEIIPLNHFQLDTDRLDNGINTFDTSNAYSNGLSEIILGKALKKYKVLREEVVILTKVTSAYTRLPSQSPKNFVA